MSLRRIVTVLGAFVATGSLVVAAAPSKSPPHKPPAKAGSGSGSAMAPAKDDGGGAGGAGGGSGDAAGSAVAPIEDTPPKDMQGTNENPDNPHGVGMDEPKAAIPVAKKPAGYPIEEVLRPITLLENMSEIGISPHFQISPYAGSDALRARYGITKQVQLGLTYLFAGIYNDSDIDGTAASHYGLHGGKAFGVDVTVLIQDWLGVRVGLPLYISPFAMSLQLAAPIKFTFGDKFALGGLDDLLNITLDRFAPSFYQQVYNAVAVQNDTSHTQQSRGHLRISAYGEYQYARNTAFIGRFGFDNDLGLSGASGAGTASGGGTNTFIRAGVQYTPRRYIDLGFSLGWDSLSTLGTFGPQFLLALRI